MCAALWAPGAAAVEESNTAALIARCAPKVDVDTMGALVRTESSGHMYVLSDDGPARLPWRLRKTMIRSIFPGSAQEAAEIARQLIGEGHLVGIGLTQISSQNLAGLGVTIEQLLDPCTNLAVGARVLRSLYQQALQSGRYPTVDQALGAAVSAYNTGNFSDGIANGYVSKVLANMSAGIPKLSAASAPMRVASIARGPAGKVESSALKARTASLDVDW
jgi:type IV secretion system protein VirB1